MQFKLKKTSLKKTLKKIELNKEPNKRRKNEKNEINENRMAKISKTGIFLKKGFGVNLYTLMISNFMQNIKNI